jgi:hypothetical protein
MTIRPKPEQCLVWAEVAAAVIDLPPYHWGMVLSA